MPAVPSSTGAVPGGVLGGAVLGGAVLGGAVLGGAVPGGVLGGAVPGGAVPRRPGGVPAVGGVISSITLPVAALNKAANTKKRLKFIIVQ